VRRRGRHRAPKRRFPLLYAALAVVVAVGTYAVDAHGGAAQAAVTAPGQSAPARHAAHWRPMPPGIAGQGRSHAGSP